MDLSIFWNKKVKIVRRSNNGFEHFLAVRSCNFCNQVVLTLLSRRTALKAHKKNLKVKIFLSVIKLHTLHIQF